MCFNNNNCSCLIIVLIIILLLFGCGNCGNGSVGGVNDSCGC